MASLPSLTPSAPKKWTEISAACDIYLNSTIDGPTVLA